jgi:D-glycerate 3-kinase
VFAINHSTLVSSKGVKFILMSQFIAAAENWLLANTSVPGHQRQALAQMVPVLLPGPSETGPTIISVCGPPGTGKSTLAGACVAALEGDRIPALVLSLDDYYLGKDKRLALTRTDHPLFSVRGVPGTHDIDLLVSHLSELCRPDHVEISLPLFDKSTDNRMEETRTVASGFSPAYIFVEGWIAGVPPQSGGALLSPVNKLESEQDQDAEWRSMVNSYLYDYFTGLNRHHLAPAAGD